MLKVSLWNSLAGEWYFDYLDLPKNYTNVEGLIDTQMHKEGIDRKEWRLVAAAGVGSAQSNPALPSVLTIVTQDVHPKRIAGPDRFHKCIMAIDYDDQDTTVEPIAIGDKIRDVNTDQPLNTYEIREPSYADGSKGRLIEYTSAASYDAALVDATNKYKRVVAVFAR